MARNFGSGRRTDKAWLPLQGTSAALTSDSTAIVGGPLSFVGPGTILRCRTNFIVAFGAATVALDDVAVCLGLGIVSTDAAMLGATAMPDPHDEPDYPWLWWKDVHMFSTFAIDGMGTDVSG